MKVLKKGTGQKGWSTKATCTGSGNGGGGCGAQLLIEEPDLFQTAHHCYDGSSDYFTTFKCVDCGVLTDLPDGRYPRMRGLPSQKAWESERESWGRTQD